MRFRTVAMLVLMPIVLAACSQSRTSRVDERTFKIEGPPVEGGAEGPNRRDAARLCPQGYRVIEETRRRPDTGVGIVTYWTIRCL